MLLVIIIFFVAIIIKDFSKGDNQTLCTMEAMQCPDGSWVGRVPPNCDFSPCPSGNQITTTTVSKTTTTQSGITTTIPHVTTTTPSIIEAEVTKVFVEGRCFPKAGAYGCCKCTVWENGADTDGFISGSAGDLLKFNTYIEGYGTVYIEFTIWLSTHNVYPSSQTLVYQSTKMVSLTGGEKIVTFNVQSCLKACTDPNIDIQLKATGLHSAYVKIYSDIGKQNMIFYTELIRHPLDVF